VSWKGWLIYGLAVVCLFALGGRTTSSKTDWFHEMRILDTNVGLDVTHAHTYFCHAIPTQIEGSADDGREQCFLPLGKDLQLTRVALIVTEQLTQDVEECEFVLETDSDPTASIGDEIVSSRMQVGLNNLDPGDGTSGNCGKALTAVGDFCVLELDQDDPPTLVSGGGWVAGHWNEGDLGGVPACSRSRGAEILLWGYYK
jgi:hypothetical protein